jgi:hypothetical protein
VQGVEQRARLVPGQLEHGPERGDQPSLAPSFLDPGQ